MLKINGKDYYIDFDRLAEYVKTDNIGKDVTETITYSTDENGKEIVKERIVTTKSIEGGIAADNLKYEMVSQFIEMLTDSYDEDDIMNNNTFKFAFNTLFKLKILTILK